jgi:Recombinase
MAKIEDLIAQIPDERLRKGIAAEVKALKKTKNFGLVFEEHLPETVRLPKLPVKPGELVALKREREETVERVKASVAIRAKLGSSLGGPSAFGYRWKDKKLAPDPKEAPVRKLMNDLFLEHCRKKTVVRLLNEAGHRTRNGSRFTSKTVTRQLQDPTAKGIHRANCTTRDGQSKRCVTKPEDEWVIHKIESIVTPEVWHQCNPIGKGEITITLCYLPPCEELSKRWRKGWDSNPR